MWIRLSVRSVCLSCDASTSAECFEASLPLLPGSSRAPRTSEPSRALRLLCLLCHGLVSVGACCDELFVICRGLHGCTNLFWTLCCCLEHLYPLLGHTFLLLSVLVQAAPSKFPARLLRSFSTWFRRVSDTFCRGVLTARVSRALR